MKAVGPNHTQQRCMPGIFVFWPGRILIDDWHLGPSQSLVGFLHICPTQSLITLKFWWCGIDAPTAKL